jgi:hypothetical protein
LHARDYRCGTLAPADVGASVSRTVPRWSSAPSIVVSSQPAPAGSETGSVASPGLCGALRRSLAVVAIGIVLASLSTPRAGGWIRPRLGGALRPCLGDDRRPDRRPVAEQPRLAGSCWLPGLASGCSR